MKPHTASAWETARRMVVSDRATYEAAAEATGISASTLRKRGAEENWMGQRSSSVSYRATMGLIKSQMAQDIADKITKGETVDPQAVFALTRLEASFPEHRYDKSDDPRLRLEVAGDVLRDLSTWLGDQDPNALAVLAPHLEGFAAWAEDHYGRR